MGEIVRMGRKVWGVMTVGMRDETGGEVGEDKPCDYEGWELRTVWW